MSRLLSSVFSVLLLALLACSSQHTTAPSVAQTKIPTNAAASVKSLTPSPLPSVSPTPLEEAELGGGLRIVPKNVKLENDKWRYKVDVDYPQIEGTKNAAILKLNREMKDQVAKEYQWILEPPTKEDIRYYREKWPEGFNSVDIDYDVVLADGDLLSIYLIGYHYGIGAAHSVHKSFSINYAFKSQRFLRLADLFKPGATYLQFISRRCVDELSKKSPTMLDPVLADALTPKAKNFESWNITKQGLRLNFDACKITGCSAGDLSVDISFGEMKDLLNPNGSLKPLLAKILPTSR